jgi:hypothetical protein
MTKASGLLTKTSRTSRTARATTILAVGACLAVTSSARVTARSADNPVKTLVAATQAYIADLESKLAYGIFDEDYRQSVRGDSGSQDRTMQGELFLTFLPKDGDWIAVHDISMVDSEPVADREELSTLLQRGPLQSIKRDVIDRNARFNIGRITRNFNEPTLALLVIEPKRVADFDFSIVRVSADSDGVRLATLHFQEKGGIPDTLIRGPGNDPARSKGDFVVETETGRVRQTLLALEIDEMSVALTTTYAREAKSGLWLPSVFEERYEGKRKSAREIDAGIARYTNFRSFEVLGRIK